MVRVKVVYDYDATQPDELTIKNGDIISDVKQQPGGWWEGSLNGKRGVFPDNFVEPFVLPPVSEPPKGPKPGAGTTGSKVADMQRRIGDQIKTGPPPKMGKPKQMAVVLFEYKPEQPDELELNEGDEVEIVRMAEEGWWEGVLRGKTGMFPSNFVKLMDSAPAPVPTNAFAPNVAKQPSNDMGHPAGGRPPLEKKTMPPPAASMDSANPPLLPKRYRGVKARVVYSYKAMNEDELTLEEGQTIVVTDQKLDDPGWWKGELNGRVGVFPDNFVELLPEDETATQPPIGRINKPPAQPPKEAMDQPAQLPPRPVGHIMKQEVMADTARGPTPPMVTRPSSDSMRAHAAPMVNGDDKVVMALREELDKLKASTVSRESFDLLQRDLKATREALESYKKESNKKLIDLMKEIDDEKKQSTQNNVELARIRKMLEDQYMQK